MAKSYKTIGARVDSKISDIKRSLGREYLVTEQGAEALHYINKIGNELKNKNQKWEKRFENVYGLMQDLKGNEEVYNSVKKGLTDILADVGNHDYLKRNYLKNGSHDNAVAMKYMANGFDAYAPLEKVGEGRGKLVARIEDGKVYDADGDVMKKKSPVEVANDTDNQKSRYSIFKRVGALATLAAFTMGMGGNPADMSTKQNAKPTEIVKQDTRTESATDYASEKVRRVVEDTNTSFDKERAEKTITPDTEYHPIKKGTKNIKKKNDEARKILNESFPDAKPGDTNLWSRASGLIYAYAFAGGEKSNLDNWFYRVIGDKGELEKITTQTKDTMPTGITINDNTQYTEITSPKDNYTLGVDEKPKLKTGEVNNIRDDVKFAVDNTLENEDTPEFPKDWPGVNESDKKDVPTIETQGFTGEDKNPKRTSRIYSVNKQFPKPGILHQPNQNRDHTKDVKKIITTPQEDVGTGNRGIIEDYLVDVKASVSGPDEDGYTQGDTILVNGTTSFPKNVNENDFDVMTYITAVGEDGSRELIYTGEPGKETKLPTYGKLEVGVQVNKKIDERTGQFPKDKKFFRDYVQIDVDPKPALSTNPELTNPELDNPDAGEEGRTNLYYTAKEEYPELGLSQRNIGEPNKSALTSAYTGAQFKKLQEKIGKGLKKLGGDALEYYNELKNTHKDNALGNFLNAGLDLTFGADKDVNGKTVANGRDGVLETLLLNPIKNIGKAYKEMDKAVRENNPKKFWSSLFGKMAQNVKSGTIDTVGAGARVGNDLYQGVLDVPEQSFKWKADEGSLRYKVADVAFGPFEALGQFVEDNSLGNDGSNSVFKADWFEFIHGEKDKNIVWGRAKNLPIVRNLVEGTDRIEKHDESTLIDPESSFSGYCAIIDDENGFNMVRRVAETLATPVIVMNEIGEIIDMIEGESSSNVGGRNNNNNNNLVDRITGGRDSRGSTSAGGILNEDELIIYGGGAR